MKIEALTVCVGYSDYLRHTLPTNKSIFDRFVVVTSQNDRATQNLCRYYNVDCVVNYDWGEKFNKGKGINKGLLHLNFKNWVVHIDADIVLPPTSRYVLEQLSLNEQFIYGIDRHMVPNIELWDRFLDSPLAQHEYAYVHVGPFPIGTRIMKLEHGGYIPLGFFQLFHRQASAIKDCGAIIYPEEWQTAASSDMHFAYRWPRTQRHLLPEIIAYHLATDDITNASMGQNWEGRKTSKFGHRDIIDMMVSKQGGSIVPDESH